MEEKVKYFNYLEKERLERIFYKQPQEFDKKTDKGSISGRKTCPD